MKAARDWTPGFGTINKLVSVVLLLSRCRRVGLSVSYRLSVAGPEASASQLDESKETMQAFTYLMGRQRAHDAVQRSQEYCEFLINLAQIGDRRSSIDRLTARTVHDPPAFH